MVSLPRNHFIALVVGVCMLSAAIGSGVALLAQTGPSGAAGKQGPAGPAGPQGPEGPSSAAEVEALEAEVGELRGEVEAGGDTGEVEDRLEALEEEVEGLGGVTSELCSELDFFC